MTAARNAVKWGLLAFVAVTLVVVVWQDVQAAGDGANAVVFEAGTYTLVTYYHGDKRCLMCNNMEKFTGAAVDRHFTNERAAGTVRLRTLNWQSPENAALTKRYALLGNAVILSDIRNGCEVRFENLMEVWDHAHDETAFVDYVRAKIAAFRAEGGA